MTYPQCLLFLFLCCFIPASAYSQVQFSAAQSVYEDEIHSFAVTDFDNDGDQDLVAIAARGDVARDLVWFENDGAGQFAATQLLLTSLPTTVNTLSVADLDNDGDVDFLIGDASAFGHGGLFWISNEAGQAGALQVINAIDSGIFRTADFDGDGDMDVIQGGAAVKLYENTGSSATRFRYAYALAPGTARALAIGDFDQDGDNDLVASTLSLEQFNDVVQYYEQREPGRLASFLNSELASFSREQQVYRRFITIAETADVDGDGVGDLILGGHIDDDTPPNEGFLYWYRNGRRRPYHSDARLIARAPDISNFRATWGVYEIAVADFDGDGDSDIVLDRLISAEDSLFWYENPGLGNEMPLGWTSHFVGKATSRVTALEAADLNNDGAADLVSKEGSRLFWYENLSGTITEVGEAETIPRVTEMRSIWPNPSSGIVTITYQLAQPVRVKIEVFDVLGRVVATLVDKGQESGLHNVEFDAVHLPSGTYVYRLTAGTFTQAKSMVLTK
ncbi:MAG TPA: FG-GAP-like repeat-containing protein [Rhodothermales bacterium]|nr:FG-GAP-like repeat-containing protein [Rhodothermales bacterium]